MLRLMQKKTAELGSSPAPLAAPTSVRSAIESRLRESLSPLRLEVVDDSAAHAGHAGVSGRAGETHFRVEVVSAAFTGLSAVSRHRLVYSALEAQFRDGLHALNISAKTPEEAGA